MPILDKLRMATSLDDIKSLLFWRAVAAEAVGTMFIVFSVCASAIGWEEDYAPNNLLIGMCMGLAVGTMAWCLAGVSGANLNPAVSFALLVTRKISLARCLTFILAQCLGAIVGSALVKGVTPAVYRGTLGQTTLHPDLAVAQGFAVEFLLTFMLVFTVFATIDNKREDLQGSGPLSIGLAVAAAHLIGLKYTGCAINPARTFGPAVITGIWKHHWVYWCGPMVGGLAAGLMYEYVFAANASLTKAKGYLLASKYDTTVYKSNPERPGEIIDEQEGGDVNGDTKV